MADKIFTSIDDFYSTVKNSGWSENFAGFVSAYENSIGGCRCSSAARRKVAENNYLKIDEAFTQGVLDSIKSHFGAEKLIFQHSGETFVEIY